MKKNLWTTQFRNGRIYAYRNEYDVTLSTLLGSELISVKDSQGNGWLGLSDKEYHRIYGETAEEAKESRRIWLTTEVLPLRRKELDNVLDEIIALENSLSESEDKKEVLSDKKEIS